VNFGTGWSWTTRYIQDTVDKANLYHHLKSIKQLVAQYSSAVCNRINLRVSRIVEDAMVSIIPQRELCSKTRKNSRW
jgi:hypothetical protein